MIRESFQGYQLIADPVPVNGNKWGVAVIIKRKTTQDWKEIRFSADDGIAYILEIEAAKEALNLGRNLILNNRVGF